MEFNCKVVLIGETGVGKTCIINRFINNKFYPDTLSSLNAQFISKEMKFPQGQTVVLELWDTAGQEKYRSIAKIFYKDARAVIMVYDITDENSFNQLKEYWIEQIKENGNKNVILAIAANKSDLIGEIKVKNEEGEKFAKEIGAIFIPTSAKNAAGIQILFESIARKILDFIPSEQIKKGDYEKENDKENEKEKGEEGKLTFNKSITLTKHDIIENKKKKCC